MMNYSVIILFCAFAGLLAAPQERSDIISVVAQQVAKKTAVEAVKKVAEKVFDYSGDAFHLANSVGDKFGSMWHDTAHKLDDKPAARPAGKHYPHHQQKKQYFSGRHRRSSNMVDALLKKKISNTFDELENVLSSVRAAREEDNSAIISMISTIFSMLKGIPSLSPILEFLRPLLSMLGIHV